MRHKLSGIIFTTHFSELKHLRMISTDACYRKFPHTEILTGCYRFDSSCGFGFERLILAFPAPNTFSLSSQCDRFLSDFSSYGWHLSSTPTCCQNYLELSGVEEAVFAEVYESIGDSILCLKGFLSEYLVLIAILSKVMVTFMRSTYLAKYVISAISMGWRFAREPCDVPDPILFYYKTIVIANIHSFFGLTKLILQSFAHNLMVLFIFGSNTGFLL